MYLTGPLFQANYSSTADIVINQGGTDSGKTREIMHVLTFIASTHPAPNEEPVITVLAESVPNLKKGAYRVFETLYNTNPYLRDSIADWNRGGRLVHFKTGWILEFIGATDEQSAKQGKRQYLFVNEANGISWPIVWQMAKRTRVRVFIDYNPSAPFWAHDKLIGTVPSGNDLGAVVQLIISDHRHNPFLSEKDHRRTEGIKDPELWRVYARGLTGSLTGLIYNDWKMIDDEDFPKNFDYKFGGLDFGYTNDPTAGVDIVQVKRDIFVQELCYEPDYPEESLKKVYYSRGYTNKTPIYCDRDKVLIRNLRKIGLHAVPAIKPPGSVKAGIKIIKDKYKVHYTASSLNIAMEVKRYMWAKDPITNKPTNEPIDQFNHCMDAIRYPLFTRSIRAKQ